MKMIHREVTLTYPHPVVGLTLELGQVSGMNEEAILEEVFQLCQADRPGGSALEGLGARSCMVGDVITLADRGDESFSHWVVMPAGFRRIRADQLHLFTGRTPRDQLFPQEVFNGFEYNAGQ